jgi:uncharacterized protein (TIGR04255 family)
MVKGSPRSYSPSDLAWEGVARPIRCQLAVTTKRPPLPDFKDPPLVEVVLGIQFDPLLGLDVLQMGRLWSVFRDEYPKHELQPMLAAQFETFERPGVEELMFPLGMDSLPARCWFLSSDETALVQVQADRFILNWRQKVGKGTYPRYESMRRLLEEALVKFRAFLQTESLGDIAPNQCEVTYVNHLDQGKGWTKPSEVAAVFPGFSGQWSSEFLPEPEDVRAALRFVIPGPGQEPPMGRLHAQIEPRYRRDDYAPLLALTLTARWIVRAFAALTSTPMHKVWERSDV